MELLWYKNDEDRDGPTVVVVVVVPLCDVVLDTVLVLVVAALLLLVYCVYRPRRVAIDRKAKSETKGRNCAVH
jgi:hypothetical protein